jgi:hypothetical protein
MDMTGGGQKHIYEEVCLLGCKAKTNKTKESLYKTVKALNDTSPTPVPKYFQRTMTNKDKL